jgi:type III pantothenate kinase
VKNKKMFLSCDIGNSNIKVCLFSENKIVESYSFKRVSKVINFFAENDITSSGISSVVPSLTKEFSSQMKKHSSHFYIVTNKSKTNLKLKYKTPGTLGTDRICSAEGAFYLNGSLKEKDFLVSIDFGTATTVNVVDYPNYFTGGIIAPGINMMSKSLHSNTAQLPLVNISDYQEIIGSSTKSSIASGLVNSTVGILERVINYLERNKKGSNIKIFITGGNAELIIPFLDFEFTFERNLVHFGIKTITELNTRVRP